MMLGPASTFDFHVEDRATQEGMLSVRRTVGKLISQEELGRTLPSCHPVHCGGNGDGSPRTQDLLVGLLLGRSGMGKGQNLTVCPRVGGLLFSVTRVEPLSECRL